MPEFLKRKSYKETETLHMAAMQYFWKNSTGPAKISAAIGGGTNRERTTAGPLVDQGVGSKWLLVGQLRA